MNTLEGNKLIAEFMGAKDHKNARAAIAERLGSMDLWLPYHGIVRVELLKYHTSWDWLMPVVEKIESLGFRSIIQQRDGISTCAFAGNGQMISSDSELSKLDAIYKAVLEFIILNSN